MCVFRYLKDHGKISLCYKLLQDTREYKKDNHHTLQYE